MYSNSIYFLTEELNKSKSLNIYLWHILLISLPSQGNYFNHLGKNMKSKEGHLHSRKQAAKQDTKQDSS